MSAGDAPDLLATLRAHGVDEAVVRAVEAGEAGGMLGNDSLCLAANDTYLDLIGYSRAELGTERVSWLRLTPTEWVAADLRGISQARAYGRSAAYEKAYVRRDGTTRAIVVVVEHLGDDPYLLFGLIAAADEPRGRAIVEGYAGAAPS